MTPPPRIEKPDHPIKKLPVPKNKAVASLIVIVPMAITSIIGVGMAYGVQWVGRVLDIPFLEGEIIFVFVILSFTFTGFMVGIKSLITVLSQMAMEKKMGPADGGTSGPSHEDEKEEDLV